MAETAAAIDARRQWQIDPRVCKTCGEAKPLTEYYMHKGRDPQGLAKYPATSCKLCIIKKEQAKYRANPNKKIRGDWSRNIWQRFGLKAADYTEMLRKQGGVCAICLGPQQANKRMAVDHCHKTGKIRGLLCTLCNSAIGKLKDDPVMIQRALDYLKEHG
jgi:hypothetical protein